MVVLSLSRHGNWRFSEEVLCIYLSEAEIRQGQGWEHSLFAWSRGLQHAQSRSLSLFLSVSLSLSAHVECVVLHIYTPMPGVIVMQYNTTHTLSSSILITLYFVLQL